MQLFRLIAFGVAFLGTATGMPAQTRGLPGRASSSALASARAKEIAIGKPHGPSSVTLSAEEMASLIEAGLDPAARRALDSLRVELRPGRLTLHGLLVTSIWGAELLGPLAYMLDPLEPMAVSGPATVAGAGVISWKPDSFTVRAFALPQAAVPRLVNRLTGGSNGTIPIPAPSTVTEVRIETGGVTFSRE